MFYPARHRPFEGYAASNTGNFEFARFSKPKSTLESNEIIVYSSELKSKEENPKIPENIIGKVC